MLWKLQKFCSVPCMSQSNRLRPPASPQIDPNALRTARQDAGLTQGQLAELVELSPQYISMLERGDRSTLSPGAFRRLCDILRVRTTELRAPAANVEKAAV